MTEGPFFAAMPPQLAQMLERQEMEVEATRHDISRFFEELSDEQLITVRRLFGLIGGSGKKADSVANYYEGICSGLLSGRGLCMGCGKDHTKALLEHDAPPTEQSDQSAQEEDRIMLTTDELQDTLVEPISVNGVPWEFDEKGMIVLDDEQKAQMMEFGLDDAYITENGETRFIGFACTRCTNSDGSPRRIFISIVDRMLRPPGPEGCTACTEKAKWG
jgi:hypothetical protein